MGLNSVFGVLSLSSLLCCVSGYCFVLPNPDIHIQVFLNYTTCHMRGSISAGYQALGDCHTFAHDEFSGVLDPLNLNYSTSAPVGAVVLGLSLLTHIHQNCSWSHPGYCCQRYLSPLPSLQDQPLPHLVLLIAGAMVSGIMSVCLAVGTRYIM
uniref:GP3 protein n=1 Tax=Free State vervet virus TaxID=1737586 RepID=A0A162L8J2_9NIDO|nr:GP3 protein [Free State vervet virus]